MLESSLPNGVKVNLTIDDTRLQSNLSNNETVRFAEKSFLYTFLDFTQKHSGAIVDIKGFVQIVPVLIKSDKPNIFTGIDKIHLKCDFIKGSIVNSVREHILCSSALSSPPGHKIF